LSGTTELIDDLLFFFLAAFPSPSYPYSSLYLSYSPFVLIFQRNPPIAAVNSLFPLSQISALPLLQLSDPRPTHRGILLPSLKSRGLLKIPASQAPVFLCTEHDNDPPSPQVTRVLPTIPVADLSTTLTTTFKFRGRDFAFFRPFCHQCPPTSEFTVDFHH